MSTNEETADIINPQKLQRIWEEMDRCGGRISGLNDELRTSRRELTNSAWRDEAGVEFGCVIDQLNALTDEALEDLKGQMEKLEKLINDILRLKERWI